MAGKEGQIPSRPIDWDGKTEQAILIGGRTIPVVFGIDPTEDYIEPSHDIRVVKVAGVTLTEGKPSTNIEIEGPVIALMTQAGVVGSDDPKWIPDSLRDQDITDVDMVTLVKKINGQLSQTGDQIGVVAACSGLSMDMSSANPFGSNVLFSSAPHSDEPGKGFASSIMSFGTPDTTMLTMSVPGIDRTTNIEQYRNGAQ